MRHIIYLGLSVMVMAHACDAQNLQLKSTDHGLNMMLLDVPKETLIDEIRFETGIDADVDVVRLDHVGPNLYPLIISSKLPIPTDSLGLLSFKLQKDSLANLMKMIDNVTPKIHSRNVDQLLIRVTYRFNGRLEQYHLTNRKIVTVFLRMVESKLIANKDQESLDTFYMFIARMYLQKLENGKRTWIYLK